MLKRSGSPPGNEKGFTLIEILVTIVLFAIVILTLFSSFDAFIASGRSISVAARQDLRAQTALKRFTDDLATLFITIPPRYQRPDINDEADPFRFSGTRESRSGTFFSHMEFATLAHITYGDTRPDGVACVRYYIRENSSGNLDLCRSDRLAGSRSLSDPCRDPVVARQVKTFDVRYMDSDGDTYEEWDSDSSRFDSRLPAMVAVRLGLARDDGTIQNVQTAIALPVNRRPQ